MVGFVVNLGAVVLGRYAQRKLLEYQDREAAECLANFRLTINSLFADTFGFLTKFCCKDYYIDTFQSFVVINGPVKA